MSEGQSLRIAVSKSLGDFTLQVDQDLEASGVTALFGRSGSGKTSLINMVAGLMRPDAGRIEIDGTVLFDSALGIDLPVNRRSVGYIFQEGRLFPHLSVQANLLYGRKRAPEAAHYLTFERVVALLDVGALLDRRPATLSGGEKQRVAIGRALLSSPRLLLMDEPLAALDAERKAEILPFIERLCAEVAVPVIYVSHALDEVLRIADRLIVMDDGRAIASGGVEEVLARPELHGAKRWFDADSVIATRIEAHEPDHLLTRLRAGPNRFYVPQLPEKPGTRVRLRVRARDVSLALTRPRDISVLNVLGGTVGEINDLGDGVVEVGVEIADDTEALTIWARITLRAARALAIEPGKPVFALIKTVAIDRYGAQGRGEKSALGRKSTLR